MKTDEVLTLAREVVANARGPQLQVTLPLNLAICADLAELLITEVERLSRALAQAKPEDHGTRACGELDELIGEAKKAQAPA